MRCAPLAAAVVASALSLVADPRRPTPEIRPVAAADPPRRPVSRCVRFSQERLAGGDVVELRLVNRCDVPLTCALAWAVRCDGLDARSEKSFVLDPGDASAARASAASCDGDWEIADVRWTCEKG
jgi:hypothetical protein